MKGARLGGLLARGLIGGVAAVIAVVGTLLTWPWAAVVGPSADERRIEDLQRVSHAVDAFRANQHVLPASLARLPLWPAAPVHTYDPITNRPYDYRPLGPLAYELCARFDGAGPEERRDFWWHDGGRYCFSLETREAPKPPSAVATDPASATAETRRPEGSNSTMEEGMTGPVIQAPIPAQTAPQAPAEPPVDSGAAAPPPGL